ncbi:hypothetical protein O181_002847 [Austropuccinia psidii MF-1]|uniref:Uncharacterized protein n=1 Tax=Austropuccinia psidii MF-1 TaxID=1389203 RepID=A0A9Q3BD90_9BASI|nr:hypothetical protein [Austropuccinia psidii MF-1]
MPTLMHELDSASPPNPLQPLASLGAHTALPIYASNAALTPPYASSNPPNPLCHLPSSGHIVTSQYAPDATYHPYAHIVPSQHS